MEIESSSQECCPRPLHSELPDVQARPLAERFGALADPTRLRLLHLLARHQRQVCVCELVEAFTLSQPTISHHLHVLRAAGLVDYEKRGAWAYYYILPESLAELQSQLGTLAGPAAQGCGCDLPATKG